jgi:hypothetical protein
MDHFVNYLWFMVYGSVLIRTINYCTNLCGTERLKEVGGEKKKRRLYPWAEPSLIYTSKQKTVLSFRLDQVFNSKQPFLLHHLSKSYRIRINRMGLYVVWGKEQFYERYKRKTGWLREGCLHTATAGGAEPTALERGAGGGRRGSGASITRHLNR